MKWNLLAPNLKTSYFQRELGKAEKQAQKLALKTFLVSHDFFAMFTSVKHKKLLVKQKLKHRDVTLWIIKKCIL